MREQTVNHAWNAAALKAASAMHGADHGNALKQWQKEQLDSFFDTGFPHRRQEDWKYTNVSAIAKQPFGLSAAADVAVDIRRLTIANTYSLVFVNGHYAARLSTIDNLPAGVVVSNLKNMLQQNLCQALQIPNDYQTPFSSLNSGLLTDGLFVSIPENTHLRHPIHLIYINTEANSDCMTHPRHLIQVGDHSRAVIFEEYIGADNTPYFTNVVTQIDAGEQAFVYHYKFQHEGHSAFHIANTLIQQRRDSYVATYHVANGALLGRDDLNYALNEQGAECQLFGLYCLDGRHHIDNHTRIDHRVAHCSSQQQYKGIMDGQSRAVFNGKIVVHPGAKQTRANQSNQNLLLSKTAEINTKPELEIYTDDVNCTHGATVGQLDEQALFYLRTRGIDYQAAHHLLVCAFANDLLAQLPHSAITDKITRHVVDRLAVDNGCGGGCHE